MQLGKRELSANTGLLHRSALEQSDCFRHNPTLANGRFAAV